MLVSASSTTIWPDVMVGFGVGAALGLVDGATGGTTDGSRPLTAIAQSVAIITAVTATNAIQGRTRGL